MTEAGGRRIEALLDPDTFVELDQVATGPGAVVGHGTVGGRDVAVYALDLAMLNETAAAKIVKIQELALRSRIPIVGLLGSSGGALPDGVAVLAGRAEILQRQVRSSGVVPQLSAVGGASREVLPWAALTDFVVDTAEEARGLLSYLPAHSGDTPPFVPTADPADRADPELQTLVRDGGPYDMREVLTRLLDDRRLLEVQAASAQSILVGFGRLAGHTVGVVANQPSVRAGEIDGAAAAKAARFVRCCDAFGVPLVSLVDAPAGLPDCSAGDRAKLLYAYAEASVPRLAVITGRASGEAYLAMSPKQLGADVNLAWPTAEVGGAGPYAAAERGYVDAVIEPRETRRVLVPWLELCLRRRAGHPPLRHGNVPL